MLKNICKIFILLLLFNSFAVAEDKLVWEDSDVGSELEPFLASSGQRIFGKDGTFLQSNEYYILKGSGGEGFLPSDGERFYAHPDIYGYHIYYTPEEYTQPLMGAGEEAFLAADGFPVYLRGNSYFTAYPYWAEYTINNGLKTYCPISKLSLDPSFSYIFTVTAFNKDTSSRRSLFTNYKNNRRTVFCNYSFGGKTVSLTNENGGRAITFGKCRSLFASEPSFSDEFNGPVNESVWQIATWIEHGGWTSKSRCYTADGYLNLIFENDSVDGWLSSAIQTRADFLYGKWEARMKPTSVAGVINAFYTIDWGTGDGTKQEVDIEFVTQGDDNIHFAVHAEGYESYQTNPDIALDFDPSDEFHIYGIEITPNFVRWTVDGEVLSTYFYAEEEITINSAYQLKFNHWSSTSGWVGGPPTADVECIYQIDWVRFYPYIY